MIILATAQVVGTLLAVTAQAGSANLTLSSQPCGTGGEWLCYRFYPAEDDQVTWTTFDEPIFDITLSADLPSNLEEWRLINASAAVGGSAVYAFLYPDSSYLGSASINVSFFDSIGTSFFSASRALLPLCFDVPEGWACSDGNSVAQYQQFGEVALGPGALNPELPDLSGPVTIRIGWGIFGDTPIDSTMRVNGVSFGFVLAPIPEPSTALLIAGGLAALALSRRRI
ncbi:MAG: PEP-CTERM sorting domain-containing protein [Myxococcota bacterium]